MESNMTSFYPGTTLTSIHNGTCYGNLTLCVNHDKLCTISTCDLTLAHFNYLPSLPGNALYAALFSICIAAQIFLGIKYRTWGFMSAALSGLALEIAGYIVRVMMNSNPFDSNYFLIYLVCLTIAPAFLSASVYLCLSRIVVIYGESVSRFRPRTYTLLFVCCDFFSLLLQAIGGAIASIATGYSTTQLGINIMLAGLSCQVVSLSIFAAACAEFAYRLYKNPTSWNTAYVALYSSKLWTAFLCGVGVATLTIFVRSCFRVAELSGGFHGPLANNEISFMTLEGAMIVTASLCLTVLHPGVCFKGAWSEANFTLRVKKDVEEKAASISSGEETATTVQGTLVRAGRVWNAKRNSEGSTKGLNSAVASIPVLPKPCWSI